MYHNINRESSQECACLIRMIIFPQKRACHVRYLPNLQYSFLRLPKNKPLFTTLEGCFPPFFSFRVIEDASTIHQRFYYIIPY